MSRAVSVVLLLSGFLVGQPPSKHIEGLQSADAVTAEIARRNLCQLPRSDLPEDKLVALLRSGRRQVREGAIAVLLHHGVAREELGRFLEGPDTGAKQQVLALASDERLGQIVVGEKGPIRAAALGLLSDRGRLQDALLAQAIQSQDEALVECACRILVLERSPFAMKVAEAAIDSQGRQILLELLAARPRLGAGPWLLRLLDQDKLVAKDRILAIQALPASWMNKRLAREVVTAAGGGDGAAGFGCRVAAARFPPALADAMVPAVVHQIQAGSRAGDVLPCLVQATAAGEQELLAQGEKLGSIAAAEICSWLAARRAKVLERRIQDALVGKSAFEPHLLRLAGPYLKTPAQVARVVKYLDGGDLKLQVLAFEELLEAKVYHPSMLSHAVEAQDGGRRALRLLNLPRQVLPEKALLELLATRDIHVFARACQLLATGGRLSKELEARLLEVLEEDQTGVLRRPAQHTLLVAGSEAAGTRVWNDMSTQTKRTNGIDWLIQRPQPWSREFLLKERQGLEALKQRDRDGERYYHRVLLALAALGDRGAGEQLLALAHELDPDLLRRGKATLLRKLTDKQAASLEKLLTDTTGRLGEEQRVELLEWVAARPDLVPDLKALLRRLWKKDSSYEIRLGALRSLLRGPGAGEIYKEVTATLAKPLDDEQEEVVFEVVGSLALPLSHDAMDFLARVTLLAPLAEPRAEVERSMVLGWNGTRGEYPLLRPVANLLRRDAKARPAKSFRPVAESLPPALINRRRLGLFLSLIAIRDSLFQDLGPVLARAILHAPDRSDDFLGPAHLALAQRAEEDGDDAGAARHYRSAGRHMLRRQLPRFLERAFLGEADPLLGYHPMADLAARPHLCDARVLMRGKEWSAARTALASARDLAFGDKQAMDEVTRLWKLAKENPR